MSLSIKKMYSGAARSRAYFVLALFLTSTVSFLITSCSKLSSFGVSAGVAFSGEPTCIREDDSSQVDVTVDVYNCAWLPPPKTNTTNATYNIHVAANTDVLWETITAQTATTSYTVKVPTGSTRFFAISYVKANKTTPNYSYVILGQEGVGKAPQFSGIKDLVANSRDAVTARWAACKSSEGLDTTCAYSLYRVVGSDTRTMVKVGETVDLSIIYTDPNPGAAGVSFLVRARDIVSNSANDANRVMLSDPYKVGSGYPRFEGLKTSQVLSGLAGLSEGKLTWNLPVDTDSISGYQVFYASTRGLPTGEALQMNNPATWTYTQLTNVNLRTPVGSNIFNAGANGWLVHKSLSEVDVVGLQPDTTYYFTVRAVSTSGALAELNRLDRSFTTKKSIITEGFGGITELVQNTNGTSDSFSTLIARWALPSTNAQGVYDSYLLTYQQVTNCSDPFTLGASTLLISDSSATTLTITGLTNGAKYRVKVQARLFNDAVLSPTNEAKCETVGAPPPIFTGIINSMPTLQPPLTNGFTQMDTSFTPASGHNEYRVYVTALPENPPELNCASHDNPDRSAPDRYKTYSASLSSPITVTGLVPLCKYRFRMTAAFFCTTPQCPSDVNQETGNTDPNSGILRQTLPVAPDGNALEALAFSETSGGVKYSVPTLPGAIYNQFVVYKSEGSTLPEAMDALIHPTTGRMITKVDVQGPLGYDDIITVNLGETFPQSYRTYNHPSALNTFKHHCWGVQPRFKDPDYPTIWAANPTVKCKFFEVKAMASFAGAISARRTPSELGFSQVQITYQRPHKGQVGWENHTFAEASCSTDNTSFPSCAGYDSEDASPTGCPAVIRAQIVRSYQVPAEDGVVQIQTLTLNNVPCIDDPYDAPDAGCIPVNNIPENKVLHCRVISVNSRGNVNVFNAGNGEGLEPVIRSTVAQPQTPGGAGMTEVINAGSTAIRVKMNLPKRLKDSVGGGLFSHVVMAINRRSTPPPSELEAAALFNNLTTAPTPGSRISVLNRNVLSILDSSLTATNLFTRSEYDISDGLEFNFAGAPAPDTNDVAILRFRFAQGNNNYGLLSPTQNNTLNFLVGGLVSNRPVCVLAKAVYMDDCFPAGGSPNFGGLPPSSCTATNNPNSHFLENNSINVASCATPVAIAPFFPTDKDLTDQNDAEASGVVLVNGYLPKPETTVVGSITQAFDNLRVDIPAVTSSISSDECNGVEIGIFDAPQTKLVGESDAAFANRIFAPPVIPEGQPNEGQPNIVPGRVEYRYETCTANARTFLFPIHPVDSDGNGQSLQRYGRYWVRARAYKTADPTLSRGALLESLGSESNEGRLMPSMPGNTELVSVTLNDPNRTPACAEAPPSGKSNCYEPPPIIPARALGDKFTARITIIAPEELDGPYAKYLNKIYVWRSYSAGGATTARTAVNNASQTVADRSAPVGAPALIIDRENPPPGYIEEVVQTDNGPRTQISFYETGIQAEVNANGYTCYVAKPVYADGSGRFLMGNATSAESPSFGSRCVNPTYNAPLAFGAQGTVTTPASCGAGVGNADGTTLIDFAVNGSDLGSASVDQYYIYYSPNPPPGFPSTMTQGGIDATFRVSETPWAVINRGATHFDTLPDDKFVRYGCAGKTISSGYFHVRPFYGPAGSPRANTSVIAYSIPSQLSNYIFVPKAKTKLAYDYYMMSMEASVSNPTELLTSADVITTDTPSTTACNIRFHNFSESGGWSPSVENGCASLAETQSFARSRPGVAPAKAKFGQAWRACRNASVNDFRIRLPTAEEWKRASQWSANDYSGQVSGSNYYGGGSICRFGGGVRNAGGNASCTNSLGMLDAAGNMKEWVDARLISQDMAGFQRGAMGFTDALQQTARMVDNGLDRLTPLLHLVAPGTAGMGLLMGSGTHSSSTYTRQYDHNTETWVDLNPGMENDIDTGFRCVAFSRHIAPTMLDLELPEESRYTHDPAAPTNGDTPGSKKDWTVPRTRYLRSVSDNYGDYRTERITFPDGTTLSGGTVLIKWAPWEKSCNAVNSCHNNFKYHVYRFHDTPNKDERFNPPWLLPSTRLAQARPLNPLAINSSGAQVWTPLTGTGLTAASACSGPPPYSCSFPDPTNPAAAIMSSTDARTNWIYVIVAEDDRGNFAVPIVQRFRTPHLTGHPPTRYISESSNIRFSSFRQEIRSRRVAFATLDPIHVDSLGIKQHVVRVPLELSGGDHDFYIYKYEAVKIDGAHNGTEPFAPMSHAAFESDAWVPTASQCYEELLRTGVVSSACGTNSPSLMFSSEPGSTYLGFNYASLVKGCLNARVQDAESGIANYYPMRPTTSFEWMAGADWGDLNLDGIIDLNPKVPSAEGLDLREFESNQANCNVTTITTNNEQPNCTSMHGMRNAVGNREEITVDRILNGLGLDNGIDGLLHGAIAANKNGFSVKSGNGNALNTRDLFRTVAADNDVGALYTGPDSGKVFIGINPTAEMLTYGGLGSPNAEAYMGYWYQSAYSQQYSDFYTTRCVY